MHDDEMPIIFQYTRAQALEDGMLVDLTEWAKETGFKIPVACTRAVWEGYIVPPAATRCRGQCERGRAHDLLWMLFNAIRWSRGGDRVHFQVSFLGSAEKPGRRVTAEFQSICGPGDHGEPVVTILLPDED